MHSDRIARCLAAAEEYLLPLYALFALLSPATASSRGSGLKPILCPYSWAVSQNCPWSTMW